MNWWRQWLAKIRDWKYRRWWQLIAAAKAEHPDDPHAQAEALAAKLCLCSARQIDQFGIFFAERTFEAYNPKLWYVTRLVTSNFEDSKFLSLMCWLVLCGRETFEQVLKAPETLAKMKLPKSVQLEIVRDFARNACQKKTGREKLISSEKRREQLADMGAKLREFAAHMPEFKKIRAFRS